MNISEKQTSDDSQILPSIPQEPSLSSQPSPTIEDDNAAKLRDYDRFSALARKKSKEAAHIGPKVGVGDKT